MAKQFYLSHDDFEVNTQVICGHAALRVEAGMQMFSLI